MTTIGTAITLMDIARRLDPDNKIATVIEVLNEQNEILEDIPFVEGNLPTGHKTTRRTGLPSVSWRQLNKGVASSKSVSTQVTDTCGMLEGFSKVDKKLVMLNGWSAAFRMSEDAAFLEAMNQEFASTLFYGNEATDPEQFTGFAPRYDTPSTTAGTPGYQMLDAGGTGSDNASIWLIGWGANTVHGIYPKGTTAGFQHTDLGEDVVADSDGNEYLALRSHYMWECGLAVRDPRYVVRICNIDVSNLVAETSAADLTKLMIKATELIWSLSGVRPVFYVDRRIRSLLRLQILAKTNVNLTFENVAGKRIMMFGEVPVRRCDQLLSTESAVTGTFNPW